MNDTPGGPLLPSRRWTQTCRTIFPSPRLSQNLAPSVPSIDLMV